MKNGCLQHVYARKGHVELCQMLRLDRASEGSGSMGAVRVACVAFSATPEPSTHDCTILVCLSALPPYSCHPSPTPGA